MFVLVSGSAETLQTLQGSAINEIPNIPQCTLHPAQCVVSRSQTLSQGGESLATRDYPMCQTLLSDFSRVWLWDQYLSMTMHACVCVCVCVCIHTAVSPGQRDRLHLRAFFGMPSLRSRSSSTDDLGDPHRSDNSGFDFWPFETPSRNPFRRPHWHWCPKSWVRTVRPIPTEIEA